MRSIVRSANRRSDTLGFPLKCLLVYTLLAIPAAGGNLLFNPGFNTDVSGWNGAGSWVTSDANADPSSGSLSGTNIATFPDSSTEVAWQCVELTGASAYDLGGKIFIPAGQTETGTAFVNVSWNNAAGCAGDLISDVSAGTVSAIGSWRATSVFDLSTPTGALSARVRLFVTKNESTGTFTAQADELFFRPSSPDVHWINAAGGLWSNPSNWSSGAVPTSTDDVFIDEWTSSYTVTLDVNATVMSLTVGVSAMVDTVAIQTLQMSGNTLTVNGPSLVDARGVFNLAGGTFTGPGNLMVVGTLEWSGGTMSGTGATNVASTGDLNISGVSSKTLTTRRINNSGSASWSGTGWIYGSAGAVINNSGTFDASADASFYYNCCSSPPAFNNLTGATFTRSGTGTTQFYNGALFNNGGAVSVTGGTLAINSGGAATNGFTVAAGASLSFGASTYVLNAGSSLGGAGTITFGGATVDVAAAVTSSAAQLVFSSGTLTGVASLTVTGALAWTGGTMSGAGSTDIATGATLAISGTGAKYLAGRTLNIAGSAGWSGTGWIYGSAGGVVNNSGSFDASADASFYYNCCNTAPTFNNLAGATFTRSGTGTTRFYNGTFFNNAGTVSVTGGTLSIDSGGTSPGSFSAAAGATLNFGGGTHDLGGAITGAGTIGFSAGTSTISGSFDV
ncbi:MAG TPA: hypothetical protein VM557_00910, partial [Thermoanaerobaculia bacterium]|nr:hypothetical protein [Thermoanaerobaculia bacterium]